MTTPGRHRPPCPRAGPRRRRARRPALARPAAGGGLRRRPRGRRRARPGLGPGAAAGVAAARGARRRAAGAPGPGPHDGVAGAAARRPRHGAPPCAGRRSRPPQRAGLVDDQRFAAGRAALLASRGAGDLLIADDLERHGVPAERRPRRDRRPGAGADAGGRDRRGARREPANGPLPGREGVLRGDARTARCGSGRRRVRIGRLHPTFHLHRAHSRKPATDHDDPFQFDPAALRRDRRSPEGTPTEIESAARPVYRDAAVQAVSGCEQPRPTAAGQPAEGIVHAHGRRSSDRNRGRRRRPVGLAADGEHVAAAPRRGSAARDPRRRRP